MVKRGSDTHGTCWLVVDGAKVAFMVEIETVDTTGPQASGTILLKLQAGQLVQVMNYVSSVVYGPDSAGGIQSWFSGAFVSY